MNASLITTETGLRAWLARKFDLINVTIKLRWAEEDREFLARQCEMLPKQLAQKDRDLAHMRVQQAILRSGR